MTPKYSYKDKEPMGGYIAYHYMNNVFDNGVSEVSKRSFSRMQYQFSYQNSLYFILARTVFLSRSDIENMMYYVGNGNTIFISADYIDPALIDTLGADANFNFLNFLSPDEYYSEKEDTWVSLANDIGPNNKYGIYFVPFSSSFSSYDTSATQVLGFNEYSKPNFISVSHGRGKFIFHLAPVAFSNYFLLKENNKDYFEKIFSYLKPETGKIYWDNYYRSNRSSDEQFSIVGFFMKHPPLFYAFLLVLAALLLFIAFGGKRKQRFIPERIPNTNTTVSYTETIGRLYLHKKDNRNIALKMFTYFLDHVRNQYYLNTKHLNNDFAEALSRKSGIEESKVKHLLSLMDETDHSGKISDLRLLEIHNLLQEYFKK